MEQTIQEFEHHSKPFFFTRWLHDKPCYIILVANLFAWFTIFLIGATGVFEQTENSNREWLVWDDYRVKRFDAFNEARELLDEEVSKALATGIPTRSVINYGYYLQVMYKSRSGNAFTVDNIKKMKKIEKYFKETLDGGKWKEFCLAKSKSDTSCSPDAVNSIADKFSESLLSDSYV